MNKNLILLILAIIIIICVIYLYFNNKSFDIKESFETYSYGPFNYFDSGASPLTFYNYPAYRTPYMYPQLHYTSYPYPYLSYGEINI